MTVWVFTHKISHVESPGDGVERRGKWVEGLVGLMRRQVRAINWGWCRRAGAGSSEDTRVSRGDPTTSVGGATHFRFPTPIEDSILTEPDIYTVAYPDVKQ
jgi:hypothetical protein